MVLNVQNSHDDSLYNSFVREFYHPDCIFYQYVGELSLYGIESFSSIGCDQIRRAYSIANGMMPDAITRFTSFQICKRLNEAGSRIIAKSITHGTVVQVPKDVKVMTGKIIESSEGESKETSDTVEYIILPQPEQYVFESTFYFDLDEFHRFIRIEDSVETVKLLN